MQELTFVSVRESQISLKLLHSGAAPWGGGGGGGGGRGAVAPPKGFKKGKN